MTNKREERWDAERTDSPALMGEAEGWVAQGRCSMLSLRTDIDRARLRYSSGGVLHKPAAYRLTFLAPAPATGL